MSCRIDAILFDLDGTLVATMEPWDRCWADYTARHGHIWTDIDRQHTHGRGDWARHVAQVCGVSVEQVSAECTDLMIREVRAGRTALLPGVERLLSIAVGAAATGLVSASPGRFVHATLARFDLHRHFRIVVTGEDRTAVKPDPAPYLYTAAQLGVEPKHCVAVEDSIAGIRSAYTAGMRVLAIPSWASVSRPVELDLADHHAVDAVAAYDWLHSALAASAAESAPLTR
ncbi:HAD-IA family hydrolase [Nocardia sp. SYP-A9097]|uniref:HAD family hydrolase n=1 Tax=Nocardia sp. SYP-A9097 TaxID=2663237 RepID=UPI00129B0FC1|nr:HAD family phosphatase [Nocardia sp. SYP-A9097]MRH93078.1 HAD-IA family hydrolase [Nocardia sp. SYP-A9097]